MTANGVADSGADYGNGYYNDHHFHYGYFLYTSAVVAHYDNEWGSAWYSSIVTLLRDIANPSAEDEYFPVHRYKDWYVGHSWASGLFVFADGKNQESTSEAVNGYYGAYLYGLAVGDAHVRDVGRLLLAMEVRSAQMYWHMTSSASVYEEEFSENKVVGIVWGSKADYSTWFGANPEYIHCIQVQSCCGVDGGCVCECCC